uniref:ABC transporter domain-containing protein n=1 Tax=Lactuca sativa TaxID=4236 RepID=A0A9R1VPZ7_LACSA|nr:hypothetical protein LSAT_V11C400162580 [Lactuca sativa]
MTFIFEKVGSGKSSLLNTIPGEMKLTKGSTNSSRSVSYVPQKCLDKNRLFCYERESIECCLYEMLNLKLVCLGKMNLNFTCYILEKSTT